MIFVEFLSSFHLDMNNSFKLIEESTLVLKTEKKTTERDLFDRELLPV